MTTALVLAAFVVGFLVAWVVAQQRASRHATALGRERDAAAQAQVRAEEQARAAERVLEQWKSDAAAQRTREDSLRAEQRIAEESRHAEKITALKGEFALLSQQALKGNSETFLQQAGQSFEERRKQIDALLGPLREQLDKLATGTQALETKREGAYQALQQQLSHLQQATEGVSRTGHALTTALRGDSRARGRWGEMVLQRVAELAGMTEHCDFELQEMQDDRSKPDMVVNLPGGDGRIPVDAKAPWEAYYRAIEASDDAARKVALDEHASALRGHVKDLASRNYASKLGSRVTYTVLFVPAEPMLAAAFETDPTLQTEALERRILLVTPVTLMALLLTVGLYWRQANLAQDAEKIAETARVYHDRLQVFMGHLGALGKSIGSTVDNWNKAVDSFQKRVLPQGRRLEELQKPSSPDKALPDLAVIDESPRELPAPPAAAREREAS